MPEAPEPTSPKLTTLRQWLHARYPTAKVQTLKTMVADGRVTIGGRRARHLNEPIAPDVEVRVSDRPARRAPAEPSIAPLQVIHEDEDVLVVHKPAGLLTSTVPGERRATALQIVRAYVLAKEPKARIGLVHRLDRDASGLLVFSKTDLAYQSLKTQFFKHTVTREYEAVVVGRVEPKRGTIDTRLVERADGTVHSTQQHAKGQRAVTEYEVVRQEKDRAVLRVTLRTGRKHQIRVHLSERGYPILGDRVYGSDDDAKRLMLAAVHLAFDHPRTGQRLRFDGPRISNDEAAGRPAKDKGPMTKDKQK